MAKDVMTKEEKMKVIETAKLALIKAHGAGVIARLGDKPIEGVEFQTSGVMELDESLGGKGWPKGRIIEIYGPESSGKTTLTFHAIAEAQKLGGVCAFIDAEHSVDTDYMSALGVDVENLEFSQPSSGEEALDILEKLIETKAFDVIVIDSVAALTPQAEIDGEMGQSHMGLQARLMSQALRKLTAKISKSNTIVIFTNQLRMKIGVMFGNPETTTGGNALKFYASVRVDIRKIETENKGADDEASGNRVRIKIVKNKIAPPFRKCELLLEFGKGVNKTDSMINIAVRYNIIDKKGSWYSYTDPVTKVETKLGQGSENVKKFLDGNPSVKETVEAKCVELMNKKLCNMKKEATTETVSEEKPKSSRKVKSEDMSISSLAEQALTEQ